jgi:hypothetical protein
MFDTFGNKVKIKSTPETEEKGVANKIGEVYGQTTPSIMDLEIIGKPKEDFAVNVHFNDLGESFWFDQDLLEYLDNGQGSVISFDGINKKWTKGENGEWIEEETISTKKNTEQLKKWWEFWK